MVSAPLTGHLGHRAPNDGPAQSADPNSKISQRWVPGARLGSARLVDYSVRHGRAISGTMPRSMVKVAKTTNKWDFEIAKIQSKMEFWRIVAYGGVMVACIVASALPLWMIHGIIQPLAGKKTEVDLSVPVTFALSVSVVVNIAQHLKGRSRKTEIQRQRERAERHEWDAGIGTS